jgi:hypothetical protein
MTQARDKANIPVLNFASKGIDDNADATAITIGSTEQIGIGSTGFDQDAKLTIAASGSGGSNPSSISANTIATFRRTGGTSHAANISVLGGSSGASILNLGDRDDEDVGRIVYEHSSNYMAFTTGASERMRLTSTGLGIGTSAPQAITEIVGGTGDIKVLRLRTGDSTAANNSGIDFNVLSSATQGNRSAVITLDADGANSTGSDYFQFFKAGGSNQKIFFPSNDLIFEGSSEHLRIKADGKIGIGTSSPDSVVNIEATKTTALSSEPHFLTLGLTVDDTTAYNTSGGVGGGIAFRGKRNSSGTQLVYGAIVGTKNGTTNDEYNGNLRFFTNNNGNGTPTEHMRIDQAGHITAPNLNTTGSTSNRYPLYWVHTGTTGSIEPYTGSIRAMKTDINDMGSVDWIHSLTPRSFKFRDYETDEDGNKVYLETTNNLSNTEYGLIAEEVNEVSGSDYILDKQTDEDGNENLKGVLYHNLVPVLLKAVQEQKNTIQELEARITTLETTTP